MGTFAENLSDLIGGNMVVLAAAKEGEVLGGCRLAEDALMLLCQSARGTYVFRGLAAAEWIKVMRAKSELPGLVVAATRRAERVAARLAAKGTVAPSSPQGKTAGTSGAIAEWAAVLSADQ